MASGGLSGHNVGKAGSETQLRSGTQPGHWACALPRAMNRRLERTMACRDVCMEWF